MLPELYLHGLAEGDFDLALQGLLGEEAPLSARTVARLAGAVAGGLRRPGGGGGWRGATAAQPRESKCTSVCTVNTRLSVYGFAKRTCRR